MTSAHVWGLKFRARVAAGSWTTLDTQTTPPLDYSWDSSSLPDGAAEIQVLATDALGNESSVTRSVTVDNVAPTVVLGSLAPVSKGLVPLNATASADTVSVQFQLRLQSGPWTNLASDSTAPYSAVVDTTARVDGNYSFRAVATDLAGHTTASNDVGVLIDNTAPSGSLMLPDSGASVSTSTVHLVASASDAGSGMVSVTFQRRLSGGSWSSIAVDATAPYEATWNRTGLPAGAYQVRAVLLDRAGNTFATAPTSITLVAGTTPPPPPPPVPTPFTFGAGKVKLSATHSGQVILSLSVQLSRAATLKSRLLKGKKTKRTWHNQLHAGTATLKLKISKRLLKKGKYTLVLTATAADGSIVQRKLIVRVPAKIRFAKRR